MVQKRSKIVTPIDFSFWRTVLSHGWCTLPPFSVALETKCLSRVLSASGTAVKIALAQARDGSLELVIHSHSDLTPISLKSIKQQVVHMLRLDESLGAFHSALSRSASNGDFDWIPQAKAGRLLRSPSLFEDVVKMICTTNCAWSATERMVENLVQRLGRRFDSDHADFPTPEQIAGSSEAFLVREVRTGYRSRYLMELSEKLVTGRIDFSVWQAMNEDDLYRNILAINGVGPYAAGQLLRLLGHYRHLALDSWCRPKFSQLYRQGRKVSDKTIERHYRKFGQWSGLVMWLDLTRDWFSEADDQVGSS
jgi:3-methyladenine DNA glycosylase/8-oxoguanine DNA glycosylase